MLTFDPKEEAVAKVHGYLLGAIAPRPIAFASTIDKDGNVNLSPYSFFNCFGANPPTLVFSPARRVRDNTIKHTLENIREVPEVVINIANYPMVEQMSLASTEYDKGVNEFVKAGFEEAPSQRVKPPRVKDAPASFECVVKEVIETGQDGGAGNLVICEVVLAHIREDILDENKRIDPYKLDAVSRMGGNYYCRSTPDSIFEIEKPLQTKGIGVDGIPEPIRYSDVLTGNNLGRLGNVERLPSDDEVKAMAQDPEVKEMANRFGNTASTYRRELHKLAQKYLEKGETAQAWQVLLQDPEVQK
ncbi:flavin reductase family protein [Roseivirga sp. BDSF3-8]|uniref:flavin reductase family protein n=1 Tax=Roseivirga sp. BDSF3-8 TaxID=3241598 RepID=UPI003531E419